MEPATRIAGSAAKQNCKRKPFMTEHPAAHLRACKRKKGILRVDISARARGRRSCSEGQVCGNLKRIARLATEFNCSYRILAGPAPRKDTAGIRQKGEVRMKKHSRRQVLRGAIALAVA